MKRLLKIDRWWDDQLALMMGFVYAVLAQADRPPSLGATVGTLGLFLLSCIGIGGFGHLLNDWYDIEQDRQSGASSLVADASRARNLTLALALLLLAGLPWIWLPHDATILGLLGLEFLLFYLYSAPPVRLKQRGFGGVMADATYSYTLSVLVALLLFARLGQVRLPWLFVGLVGLWAFSLGLRQILLHQIEDLERDEAAAIPTFATRVGWSRSLAIVTRGLVPLEAGLFLVLLVVLSRVSVLIPLGFLAHTAWQLDLLRVRGLWQTARPWQLPAVDRLHWLAETLLRPFYTLWLPIFTLLALVVRHPTLLPLAGLHLLLFRSGPWALLRYEWPAWLRLRRVI